MSTRPRLRDAFRARELMRLKTTGVPIAERFRIATRNGTLRAATFGVNDGLVSNLALIMGVAGAVSDRSLIVLAGVAGLLAGALSMAAGEYLSMRVQREVGERVLRDERVEIERDPLGERAELAGIYRQRGFSAAVAERMAQEAMANPALAFAAHRRDELGLDDVSLGSAWGAALSSFTMFALGAAVPLLPFVLKAPSDVAVSVLLSLATLSLVGAATALMSSRPAAVGALRMAAIGGGAAAVTYLIGSALGVAV